MWLPAEVVDKVEKNGIRIGYVDKQMTKMWNDHRKKGELRLLTGWYWVKGRQHRQGFKTKTVAIRDAYYVIVERTEAPSHYRLSVVKRAA